MEIKKITALLQDEDIQGFKDSLLLYLRATQKIGNKIGTYKGMHPSGFIPWEFSNIQRNLTKLTRDEFSYFAPILGDYLSIEDETFTYSTSHNSYRHRESYLKCKSQAFRDYLGSIKLPEADLQIPDKTKVIDAIGYFVLSTLVESGKPFVSLSKCLDLLSARIKNPLWLNAVQVIIKDRDLASVVKSMFKGLYVLDELAYQSNGSFPIEQYVVVDIDYVPVLKNSLPESKHLADVIERSFSDFKELEDASREEKSLSMLLPHIEKAKNNAGGVGPIDPKDLPAKEYLQKLIDKGLLKYRADNKLISAMGKTYYADFAPLLNKAKMRQKELVSDWMKSFVRIPKNVKAAKEKVQYREENTGQEIIQPIRPVIQPISGGKEPKLQLTDIQRSLLECFSSSNIQNEVSQEFMVGLEKRLKEILSEFNINSEVDCNNFDVGPRLVRANIKLGRGVKISALTKISEDIANKLFSDKTLFAFEKDDEVPKNVLIESVPAKGTVGIYLPQSKFSPVGFREVLETFPAANTLNFSVGKNIAGENQYSNLEDMPHLLVAGHTNSGKSVFINSLIVGLLFQNTPTYLKLTLIDPKGGLEFGAYEGLPFLQHDEILENAEDAEKAFSEAVEEMKKRYKLFKDEKVKKLSEYNEKNSDKLPYLVIIIDEFADIILNEKGKTRKELSALVQKLAQKGRAAGVHIIIATQKPVNECFPTMIKGNIPARIAFRVTKSEESNVILNETGAETLFGKGDMLVKEPGHNELRRFQAPYLQNEEIERFVEKLKEIWGRK